MTNPAIAQGCHVMVRMAGTALEAGMLPVGPRTGNNMCGRYTLATPVAELSRIFGFSELPNLAPRYNIAPTQEIAAVRLLRDEERRELVLMRWGLVPYWADDPSIGSRM